MSQAATDPNPRAIARRNPIELSKSDGHFYKKDPWLIWRLVVNDSTPKAGHLEKWLWTNAVSIHRKIKLAVFALRSDLGSGYFNHL